MFSSTTYGGQQPSGVTTVVPTTATGALPEQQQSQPQLPQRPTTSASTSEQQELQWEFQEPGLDSTWLGLQPGCTAADIDNLLRHIHAMVGHASPTELVQILKDCGAAKPLIDAVTNLECSLCNAIKRPRTVQNVRLPMRARSFNQNVYLDMVHINIKREGKQLEKYDVLTAMDEWTSYTQAWVLPEPTAECVKLAFQSGWSKPYGAPVRLLCDPDSVFRNQEVRQVLQRYCTQ